MMKRISLLGLLLLPALTWAEDPRIRFNQQVRPILSDTCFQCHGPDRNKRKPTSNPLRLDLVEQATATRKHGAAIVPGKPDKSLVLQRIHSDDPDEVMPPSDSKRTLSAEQKKVIGDWIAQGAPYEDHWAYVPPQKPTLPEVSKPGWARNAIDRFILSRLDREGALRDQVA